MTILLDSWSLNLNDLIITVTDYDDDGDEDSIDLAFAYQQLGVDLSSDLAW